MKLFLAIFITAALAATATWIVVKPKPATVSTERKPLFYQSAMHPWIKSDKPGRCTICGMELTPVYAGDPGFDQASDKNLVTLTASQSKILGVATSVVKKQPLTRSLSVTGMIDDDETRHRILSAYVSGRIETLSVNYVGATVTAGQPLAEIYSPTLLQTEREYRQLSGDLKRITGLRLQQMGLTPEQIAAIAEKPVDSLTSQILAPMSGTVVARDIYEGQYVAEGAKLFEIADFSTMWFKFDAYEQDMPWLEIGQSVKITTASKPGETFEGKITFIDPNFTEETRSTKVRVELPNPDCKLQHRITADGEVLITTPEILTIPKSAVMQTGSQALVYVDQKGGSYEQRPVKLGRRGDSEVEVLSGLKAGETVVTTGTILIDGQAELNHSFTPVASAELSETKLIALREFITVADAMSAALAADDLAKFNEVSKPAMEKTAAFTAAFGDAPKLTDASHFHGFPDLKAARQAFYPFSMAAVEFLLPLQKSAIEFQLWECPMADEAIPIPGKKGRWIQLGKRANQNPYFGKAMLSCGEQIKEGVSHD